MSVSALLRIACTGLTKIALTTSKVNFGFDTSSQMLFTYNISGVDRLARKAFHDFHTSLRPDGLISMRYPAHTNVTLPVLSLFYPLMIEDHINYYGDRELAAR